MKPILRYTIGLLCLVFPRCIQAQIEYSLVFINTSSFQTEYKFCFVKDAEGHLYQPVLKGDRSTFFLPSSGPYTLFEQVNLEVLDSTVVNIEEAIHQSDTFYISGLQLDRVVGDSYYTVGDSMATGYHTSVYTLSGKKRFEGVFSGGEVSDYLMEYYPSQHSRLK